MSLHKELSKLFPQCDRSPWDLYITKFIDSSLGYNYHLELAIKAHTYENLDDGTKHYIKCCQNSNEIARKKSYDINNITDEQLKEIFKEVLELLPDETTDEDRAMFEAMSKNAN